MAHPGRRWAKVLYADEADEPQGGDIGAARERARRELPSLSYPQTKTAVFPALGWEEQRPRLLVKKKLPVFVRTRQYSASVFVCVHMRVASANRKCRGVGFCCRLFLNPPRTSWAPMRRRKRGGAHAAGATHPLPPQARSGRVPASGLALEYVYGFNGEANGRNLFSVRTPGGGGGGNATRLVFAAAAVVVVHDPATRRQRFFMGHDDSVVALAVDASGTLAASAQCASLVGGRARPPQVLVWDLETLEVRARGFDDGTYYIEYHGFWRIPIPCPPPPHFFVIFVCTRQPHLL